MLEAAQHLCNEENVCWQNRRTCIVNTSGHCTASGLLVFDKFQVSKVLLESLE